MLKSLRKIFSIQLGVIDTFNETWCNRYNSEIVFFAKKIKFKKFDPMKMSVDKFII